MLWLRILITLIILGISSDCFAFQTLIEYCSILPDAPCTTSPYTDTCGYGHSASCTVGFAACCSQVCVDLNTDPNNCGACGVVAACGCAGGIQLGCPGDPCTEGSECESGVCYNFICS